MKNQYQLISYCGKYHCGLCAYHRGTMVSAAKNLLKFVENYGSLKLIANNTNTCNFDEFHRGLRWLASQQPCKGCRFGGGWSWWPDCPVRDCCIQRGIDFCYQCTEFPCQKLRTAPLLERKQAIIEANKQIQAQGIDQYLQELKERYAR